jgi:hypothetical protein
MPSMRGYRAQRVGKTEAGGVLFGNCGCAQTCVSTNLRHNVTEANPLPSSAFLATSQLVDDQTSAVLGHQRA